MSDDIGELAELRATVHDGFARMDRYFELQQAQYLELRAEVKGLRADVDDLRSAVVALTARVERLENRVLSLEHEVRALRDWATLEFADVRGELRELRLAVVDGDRELRRDVDQLEARVARLEQRWDDAGL